MVNLDPDAYQDIEKIAFETLNNSSQKDRGGSSDFQNFQEILKECGVDDARQ